VTDEERVRRAVGSFIDSQIRLRPGVTRGIEIRDAGSTAWTFKSGRDPFAPEEERQRKRRLRVVVGFDASEYREDQQREVRTEAAASVREAFGNAEDRQLAARLRAGEYADLEFRDDDETVELTVTIVEQGS